MRQLGRGDHRRPANHAPPLARLRADADPAPGCFARPILACGGHLKNAFCLAWRGEAWMGPHIGDLETDEACRAFEETVERFSRLVGITPEVVAFDRHPDYFSTRYALTPGG